MIIFSRISTFLFVLFGTCTLTVFGQIQIGQDLDGEGVNDFSGRAIVMPDNNTVAIGAYQNSGNGTESGHVRVYTRSGTTWIQKGLDIDGESANDLSGWSLCMPNANTIAIGAYENDGGGVNSGHVRVYQWTGSAWSQKGMDINGLQLEENSGFSVSMPDANTIAVGAILNDFSENNAGAVRVYQWLNNSWVQKGATIYGEAESDESGRVVQMPDPNTVAISAPGNDDIGNNAGHVRVYVWQSNAWVQLGSDIDAEAADDGFGISLSMPNATTFAAGAYGNSGAGFGSGSVRVFQWDGTTWSQKGNDIDGAAIHDESGMSVHMPDENTVAIGAPGNDGSGPRSGHVRVYFWNGVNWVQHGADINGEASYDESGYSVYMPNRTMIAVGAPQNDGAIISNSGHVRVYSLCTDSINVQPQDFTAYAGVGWANFNCSYSDTSALYQWQTVIGPTWTNLTNQTNYAGALSDSLIITGVTPAWNNRTYRCLITTNCTTDTTNPVFLTVQNGIGIEDESQESIVISPNPTFGQVHLNKLFIGTMELVNANGIVLFSKDASNDVDLTFLPTGVYTLRLSNPFQTFVYRILKM